MIDPSTPLRPYDAMLEVASSGRVFLAEAMVHYCLLHWGANAEDVAAALGVSSASKSGVSPRLP